MCVYDDIHKKTLSLIFKINGGVFLLLKDVLKEFLFELKIRNYANRTIGSYNSDLNLFFKFLKENYGIADLEEIKSIHIKEYLIINKNNNLKATTINSRLKHFRIFFKYCKQEEYCEDLTLRIRWLKEDITIIKTFNDDEVKKMINAYSFSSYMEARNKCILVMLFDTGIRNMELCLLLNSNIKENRILVHGKGSKERYVGISPYLKKTMMKYERIRDKYFKKKTIKYDNYFLSSRYKPLTDCSVDRVVKTAGKVAGIRKSIRCSSHTCRHWFAQSQIKNKLDLFSLSRILGHESVSITRQYLRGLEDLEILRMSVEASPLMNF